MLLEACVAGDDLRLVVIDYKVVAAAMRRPARVVGDGKATVRELIATQSRRRAAATGGESRIPLDAETERCVAAAGLALDDVPAQGRELVGAQDRQPAHRRHDPRRDRRDASDAGRRGDRAPRGPSRSR